MLIPGSVPHGRFSRESPGGMWAHGYRCPERALSSTPACGPGRAAVRAATAAVTALLNPAGSWTLEPGEDTGRGDSGETRERQKESVREVRQDS